MVPLIANTPYSMRFNHIHAIKFSTKREDGINLRFALNVLLFVYVYWLGRDERHVVAEKAVSGRKPGSVQSTGHMTSRANSGLPPGGKMLPKYA